MRDIKTDLIFAERQYFRQWWIILILLGLNILTGYVLIHQLFLGKPFGQNPMSNFWLIFTSVFIFFLSIFIFIVRLETIISTQGIHVLFFPFHLKFRKFNWDEISNCYVREYAPIGEFGGWGIRFGLFGQGKAWNVSGNAGLQIEFKNGKKLLIGTRKPDLIVKALDKMKNKI